MNLSSFFNSLTMALMQVNAAIQEWSLDPLGHSSVTCVTFGNKY